jgi:ppGpp synthetase/RelA/SpoT-type nucleotidyltranferase
MEISKTQITKLGKKIRVSLDSGAKPEKEDLVVLQNFRRSFKDDLAPVFQSVAELSRSDQRKDAIVSFRIKRIESILSKIKREPTMALGNMGDIAGCRVIVYSDTALSRIVQSLHNKFEVTRVKDYTKDAKPDGYRGYHIYVKSPVTKWKILEIQVRHISTHRWASFVEIVDVIYDLKLKEGQVHENFQELLLLMAQDIDSLSMEEKRRIMSLDAEHNVYRQINKVFISNNIPIRQSWLEMKDDLGNPFFIIEVDDQKKSSISSFKDYSQAEERYFKMFLDDTNSNFVLTYLETPNFNRLCVAYASYMMVKHDYLSDWHNLTHSCISESAQQGDLEFYTFFNQYAQDSIENERELVSEELKQLGVEHDKGGHNGHQLEKIGEWIENLKRRTIDIGVHQKKLSSIEFKKKKSFLEKLFS